MVRVKESWAEWDNHTPYQHLGWLGNQRHGSSD